jgi:hypothetical protein
MEVVWIDTMFPDIRFPRTFNVYSGRDEHDYRDDLVMTREATETLFQKELIVQEKIDGANLGLFLDKNGVIHAVKRNTKIDLDQPERQFRKLKDWITLNYGDIYNILDSGNVIFGEWLYSKHSVVYDRLPSYFLCFDIYCLAEQQFYAQHEVEQILHGTGIKHNPVVFRGHVGDIKELEAMIQPSQFGPGQMEGVYIRVDGERFNESRCKLVHRDFIQTLEDEGRWDAQPMVLNISLDERERPWAM